MKEKCEHLHGVREGVCPLCQPSKYSEMFGTPEDMGVYQPLQWMIEAADEFAAFLKLRPDQMELLSGVAAIIARHASQAHDATGWEAIAADYGLERDKLAAHNAELLAALRIISRRLNQAANGGLKTPGKSDSMAAAKWLMRSCRDDADAAIRRAEGGA